MGELNEKILRMSTNMVICGSYLLVSAAVREQRTVSATAIGSIVGDSSPANGMLMKDKSEDKFELLGIQIQRIPLEVDEERKPMETEFHLEDGMKAGPSVEHQFIVPSSIERSPLHQNEVSDKAVSENLASLRNDCDEEDIYVSLQLGDNEAKRRRSEASSSRKESK